MIEHEPLTGAEAAGLIRLIEPGYEKHIAKYNAAKYPEADYESAIEEFAGPSEVSAGGIRDALRWKYGHPKSKLRIPDSHESLIREVQEGWAGWAGAEQRTPEEAFTSLQGWIGGRFITVAFLTHLMHPSAVPIIDQHNFRAVNHLMSAIRRGWKGKAAPSRFSDILLVGSLMRALLDAQGKRPRPRRMLARELDKYLMMYGKALKRHPVATRP